MLLRSPDTEIELDTDPESISYFTSEVEPLRPAATSRFPLFVALLCLALAPLALMADLPLARLVLTADTPDDIERVLKWSEVLAHGIGVAIIALMVIVLDPAKCRFVPRLLAAAYGSGLLVNGLKLLVVRYRPRHFPDGNSVFDTFAGWLPLFHSVEGFEKLHSGIQSFPSGHAAVAVAFTFGLARIYPRGRVLFAVFVLLAAIQRVQSGDHFLSDTLIGAAVGATLFWVLSIPVGLGRWLTHIESPTGQRIRARGSASIAMLWRRYAPPPATPK